MNDECKEADAYVRDHLLIDFMCHKYNISMISYEEIYEEWIDYLKELEAKNEQS